MPVIRIDRFEDSRLEAYRSVSDPELLRRRSLFVAEGRLVVGRLLASEHRIMSVLVNDASFRALEQSFVQLPATVPIYVCNTGDFASLTGFNLHRGCLAMAKRPAARTLRDISAGSQLLLVLEAITDADNVGSAFRNAAAFGVDGVVLSPTCCDPLYRKAIRTSMGSVLRVPYTRPDNWPDGLISLKADGFAIIALTPRADGVDLSSMTRLHRPRKIAVLVGSEGAGLTPGAAALADMRLRIPISQEIDSLNLATATGIALYQLRALSSW